MSFFNGEDLYPRFLIKRWPTPSFIKVMEEDNYLESWT
jgi:hypothetical protein